MTPRPFRTAWTAVPACFAVLSCGGSDAPTAVEPFTVPELAAARSAERCVNVDVDIETVLGLWMIDGQVVGGAVPAPITLGGVEGWLASFVENPFDPPRGNSTTSHWELTHVFFTSEPGEVDLGGGFVVQALDMSAQTDWFMTDDTAVCAAAGHGPAVCRINDHLPIVAGAGMYAGAEGFLHNHGWITITDPATAAGSGQFTIRGRICGDGV